MTYTDDPIDGSDQVPDLLERGRFANAVATGLDAYRTQKSSSAAAHLGESPGRRATGEAVQVEIDYLSAHGRYHRIQGREPVGSELVTLATELPAAKAN